MNLDNDTGSQPGISPETTQAPQQQQGGGNEPPPSTPVQPLTATKVNPFEASHQEEPEWVKTMRAQQAAKSGQSTTPPKPAVQTPTQPAVQQPATQQPQVQQPTAPVTQPTFSTEQLTAAVRAGMEPVVAAMTPAPTPRIPTDAEVMSQMNVYQATPQVFEQMFGIAPERPEQVQALNDALQGVARQAVTIASFLQKQAIDQVRSEMQPYVNAVRAEQAQKYETDFFKGNQDLVQYRPLAMQVFRHALAEGRRFPTPQAAGQFVADTTRQLLKDSGITLPAPGSAVGQAGTTGSGTTPGSSQRTRTMTPTSMGGRGGGSASATPTKSTAELVFGPH